MTPAEKTIKVASPAPQKAPGSFFRKAGEEAFFQSKKTGSFFNAPVQAKLQVNSPDDPQEKEADQVADKVMRVPDAVISTVALPAKEDNLQRDREEEIQAKTEIPLAGNIQCKEARGNEMLARMNETAYHASNKEGFHVDASPVPSVERTTPGNNHSLYHSNIIRRSGRGPPQGSMSFHDNLAASKGAGNPIPADTRTFMENRFNADFSNVRVHHNASAEQMSTHIQARAFTHGSDIYFNRGKYEPGTSAGNLLLAHELTHTIQQGSSQVNASVAHPAGNADPISRKQENILHRQPSPAVANPPSNATIDLSGKSGGSVLPSDAREYFQSSFQTDVSDIRVHTDDEAADICKSKHVAAFTQGRHICFAPGRYAPESEDGGILLAKQVSDSLNQRSIGVPGLAGQINAGIREARSGDTAGRPKAKLSKNEEDPAAAKKKKKSPGDKESKGKKEKVTGAKSKKKKKPDTDGVAVKSPKVDPAKSPSSPDEDPAFQRAVKKSKESARNQKKHDAADTKAGDAQKAAPPAPREAESKAQDRKADGMDAAGARDKPFDSESFKTELLKKIESITPGTLEEATEFKENNRIGEVKSAMGDKVGKEKENTTGPVSHATTQPLQVNEADKKHPLPLPPTVKGAIPAGPAANDAAPKNKLNKEISLQEQSKSLDDEMKANNVTEEQLANSNEPGFTAALNEKRGAQKDAVQQPLQYRKDEALMLKEAKSSAQQVSARSISGMFTARGKNFDTLVEHQQTTKQKDEERRANVAKDIEEKYQAAEKKVIDALSVADSESNRIFEQGSEAARQEFENDVAEKMRAYKKRRYSGFWGGLRWGKDKLFGMPDDVNVFYTQGRQKYLNKMDQVITQVAAVVTTKLNEAKQAIKDGKKAIDDYVSNLPKDLEEVGREATSNIQDKFDSLEQTVNEKRDQLIEGLAKKYVDNVKKLDDRITEMKEANQGLIDKAIGLLKKVWKVIKDLTNLFTTILSRLASIIGTILSSPSGFFGNLARAFKMGFDNFKSNFLEYLERGLMDWLVTNLGLSGIEMPKKFDPVALFSLALQVMGITKPHIRERAVALLDEEKVSLLETSGGIIYRVYNEGPGALWDMIYEKLTDFKDIIWETIKSFIQKSVIEAALIFLLSMLNPVGAFVKVCMAIYDFLMMLVKFKDRIVELLDTILGAVMNIASGAIDGAAKAIESAFAKSIPVIIGFLAALLHLNNITAKVRDIILRIQKRVEKALDWAILKGWSVIGKTVQGALRIKQKGKEMVEKGKDKLRGAIGGGGTPQERLDKAMVDARNAVNSYAGKKVGALILKPLLSTIKFRYGLVSLDLIARQGKWAIRGEINPVEEITSDAEVQEGPEGGQAKTTIQKILGFENGEMVQIQQKPAGKQLRELLNKFVPSVLSNNENRVRKAVNLIRGKDSDYTIYQGAIYAPFIEDQGLAIQQLKEQMPEEGYFLSLDRGGSMVGDQITKETRTVNQSIPKEEGGNYRAKQLSDLSAAIDKIMEGQKEAHVRITISETSVSGSSMVNLIGKLKSILGNGTYPNLKFKILVLQQTITGHEESAKGLIYREIATAANKIEVIISGTPYILGEDVNYQIAKNNENSSAPIIIFKGSEEKLTAYKITPVEGSTARDIIIDLVDGKYRGKLPGVL